MQVKFRITQVICPTKGAAEIRENNILIGELDRNQTTVYYKDSTGSLWSFWVNDTCEIVI